MIFYQFKHFYKSYAFGAASVLSQSLYLLTLQKMGSENQLGKVTQQSYNAKQPQALYFHLLNFEKEVIIQMLKPQMQ